MRRIAAVAGQFYQGSSAKLTHQVQKYVLQHVVRETALGVLCPHAGLIYSGSVAGAVYSLIAVPEIFLLIGPNHTGLGSRMAMMTHGEWEIPTGVLSVDEKLARRILSNVPVISSDTQAHLFEHSLEVQLPFITYLSKESRIVPLTVMSASLDECRSAGEGIARSVQEISSSVVIVASSDMSHYVSDETARKKDRMAIDMLLSLDPEGLYRTVEEERITMCGYLPATIMLFAVKSLGAKRAKLIQYATSGETSGDYDHVVGYAGIIVS
ncbi:MAG TPA: AmmeMemoRadiSam system protein B [Thermodesulfovibrionales bacterium]|nr:AmmeMemoRadiSam system protein B [Thermodesulfovibrionales bacterium]